MGLREIFELPRDFIAWIAYLVFHWTSEPEERDSIFFESLFDDEDTHG